MSKGFVGHRASEHGAHRHNFSRIHSRQRRRNNHCHRATGFLPDCEGRGVAVPDDLHPSLTCKHVCENRKIDHLELLFGSGEMPAFTIGCPLEEKKKPAGDIHRAAGSCCGLICPSPGPGFHRFLNLNRGDCGGLWLVRLNRRFFRQGSLPVQVQRSDLSLSLTYPEQQGRVNLVG